MLHTDWLDLSLVGTSEQAKAGVSRVDRWLVLPRAHTNFSLCFKACSYKRHSCGYGLHFLRGFQCPCVLADPGDVLHHAFLYHNEEANKGKDHSTAVPGDGSSPRPQCPWGSSLGLSAGHGLLCVMTDLCSASGFCESRWALPQQLLKAESESPG